MRDPYAMLSPYGFDVPPVVVTFCPSPTIAEMGSTIPSVVLRWSFNRDLDTLVVNGTSFAPNAVLTSISGPFTTDATWSIKGTVIDYEQQATGKATLSFQNKAYWGNVATRPLFSGDVLALPGSSFVTTRTKLQIGFPCYGNTFPVYCYPSRFGQIQQVKVNIPVPNTRAETAWVKFTDLTTTTISVTNPSGFTEAYCVTIFNSLPFAGFFEVRWNG